jgi:hypothetical protein
LLEEYNRQLDSIQQLQNKIKQNKEMGVENTDQTYLNFVNNSSIMTGHFNSSQQDPHKLSFNVNDN